MISVPVACVAAVVLSASIPGDENPVPVPEPKCRSVTLLVKLYGEVGTVTFDCCRDPKFKQPVCILRDKKATTW